MSGNGTGFNAPRRRCWCWCSRRSRLGATAPDAIGLGNIVAEPGQPILTARYNGWVVGKPRYTITNGAVSSDTDSVPCTVSTAILYMQQQQLGR
jgi:hypothetical protein